MPSGFDLDFRPFFGIIHTMGIFKKRCKTYRCQTLHMNKSGYCDACQAKRSAGYMRNPVTPKYSEDRPSANERGYNASWHKFASKFLADHPVCEHCGKPAQCVDHKEIPAEIMMDLYGKFDLDPGLYQALCFSCNRRKEIQDRQAIKDYFKMKADLQTPGGGVKTFSNEITTARSVLRDIEEKFSKVVGRG